MAKMPASPASPAPADDDQDPDTTADNTDQSEGADADEGDDQGEDEDSGDQVLVTITKSADGTYMVIAGDEEDDEGEGSDEDAGGEDEGASGAEPGASGETGDESEGKPANSIGAALKLVMDILKSDEAESSGQGSEADNFSAGYSGDQAPTPAAPGGGISQKY